MLGERVAPTVRHKVCLVGSPGCHWDEMILGWVTVYLTVFALVASSSREETHCVFCDSV